MASIRSLNKVMLIGNLTGDPEVRYTPKGSSVCGFTIATNRGWKDANGEKQEVASFHRISIWGKLGETLSTLLKKGMKVFVEGELRYSDRKGPDGRIIARQADITVYEVVILDSKKSFTEANQSSSFNNNSPQEQMPKNDQSSNNANVGVESLDIDSIINQMDNNDSATNKPKTVAETVTTEEKEAPVDEDTLPF